MDFSVWMAEIGRETLTQAKENLVEGIWIKDTSNAGEQVLDDLQLKPIYKYITSQQIDDGYDYDVDVDVMNQTPAAMAQQQQAFITFVSLITKFPQLAMSPILIREAAYRSGYRNEKVIHQMQQVAVLSLAAKAQQAQNPNQPAIASPGQQGQANNPANAQVSQMASPMADQTDQQLEQQLM
jgi:hypothetical protein